MGRPSLLTEERSALIVDAISKGLSREGAAGRVAITRTTLQEWLAKGRAMRSRDPEQLSDDERKYLDFADAVEKADSRWEEGALSVITRAAQEDRTWQAAAWLLERRHPDRYGRRIATEVSGPGGGPIELVAAGDVLSRFRSLAERHAAETVDGLEPAELEAGS